MPGLSQDLLEGSLTRAVSDVSCGLEVKGVRFSLGPGCHCMDFGLHLKLDGKTLEGFEQSCYLT